MRTHLPHSTWAARLALLALLVAASQSSASAHEPAEQEPEFPRQVLTQATSDGGTARSGSGLTPADRERHGSLRRTIYRELAAGRFTSAQLLAERLAQETTAGLGSDAGPSREATALWTTTTHAARISAERHSELQTAFARMLSAQQQSLFAPDPAGRAPFTATLSDTPLANDSSTPPRQRSPFPWSEVLPTLARCLGEDDPLTAVMTLRFAWDQFRQGNWRESLQRCEQVERHLRDRFGDDYLAVGSCLELQGAIHRLLQHDALALELLGRAQAIYVPQLGERHPIVTRCRIQQASLWIRNGRYELANGVLAPLIDEPPTTSEGGLERAAALLLLSEQCREDGRLLAEEQTLRGILAQDAVATPAWAAVRADALARLAACLRGQGRFAEAESYAINSYRLVIARYGNRHPHVARAAWNLAHVRYESGKYQEALVTLETAARLQRAHDPERSQPLTHDVLRLQLQCQRRLGLPANASEYEQCLREHLRQLEDDNSLAAPDRVALTAADLGMHLSEQGRIAEGSTWLRRALRVSEAAYGNAHGLTNGIRQCCGELAFRQGRLCDAVDLLSAAAATAEEQRAAGGQTGLLAQARHSFNRKLPLLAICYAHQGDAVRAWEQLEASTARGLWDQWRDAPSGSPDAVMLSQAISRPFPFPAEDASLPTVATDSTPHTAHTRHVNMPRDPYPWARVQATIPPDTALVAWAGVYWQQDGFGEFWACVLRHCGPPRWMRLDVLPSEAATGRSDESLPVENRAGSSGAQLAVSDALWNQVRRRPEDTLVADGLSVEVARVARQRLAPVLADLATDTHLPAVRRLVVILPGPSQIPVEVLTDDYIVHYAPSATIYAWLREQQRARQRDVRVLAVGQANAPLAGSSVERALARPQSEDPGQELPGARRELTVIATLFANRTILPLDEDASETLQRMASAGSLRAYSHLHFATHGEASRIAPLQSALVLSGTEALPAVAPPNSSDSSLRRIWSAPRRLTAEQVLREWQLDADLVTLAACDSAVGPAVSGEYLLGFSQAFLAAGSRSVLASLWPVDDQATACLMQRFYENLLGTRPGMERAMTKAAALQEAKQWLRRATADELEIAQGTLAGVERSRLRVRANIPRDAAASPYAHPYYWAPFILIGADE